MTKKAEHGETLETPLEEGAEVAIDVAETESLQAQYEQMKDQWLRAVAELENTRRRAQKEREDALRYAATNFSRDILGVYDSLSRAAEMFGEVEKSKEEIKSFVEGVHLTLSELNTVFIRHGVKKVDPLNEPFDPNFHQAMFEVPTNDVVPGTVVQVMQAGFTIHDRLLRPALVGVSKKSDS